MLQTLKTRYGFVNVNQYGITRIQRGEKGTIMGEQGEGNRRIFLVKFSAIDHLVAVHTSFVDFTGKSR